MSMPRAATSVTTSSRTLPARNFEMWILRAAYGGGKKGWKEGVERKENREDRRNLAGGAGGGQQTGQLSISG